MDTHYFVGIDIAKETLDWAVYTKEGILLRMHTDNTIAGIKKALRQLKALPGWLPTESVFCMEYTGIYNAHLLGFMHKLHFPIWLENSLQIKQAGGMQRGKNDMVDTQRIAEYAFRFRDKIMACHAGVVPFEYRSSTSIRGKTRVSHQARKRLKSLFHLGAMSVIRKKGELGDYYQRKVAEGKNKMLVLNAVRNKLIHRVYAVVHRGEKYNEIYVSPLA